MKDDFYMDLAIKEAKKAYNKGEVPVGCIIVINDEIIVKAHNLRQTSINPLGHAEVNAITKACKKLKRRILDDATLYVTLEPCLMCSGLIIQTRIKKVVFGAFEPKFGVMGSLGNVYDDYHFNHKPIIVSGIKKDEISDLMKSFFQKLRENKLKINL